MPSLSSSKQLYGYKSNNPDQVNADCKCLDSAGHEKASLTLPVRDAFGSSPCIRPERWSARRDAGFERNFVHPE
jgi:hypothetical protein